MVAEGPRSRHLATVPTGASWTECLEKDSVQIAGHTIASVLVRIRVELARVVHRELMAQGALNRPPERNVNVSKDALKTR